MKVTITRAIRLPGRRLYPAGSVIEVTAQEKDYITTAGAIDRLEVQSVPVAVKPEPEPEPEESEPVITPPRKSASLKVWRDYAAALGIETTGMTREQIITAVSQL